MKVTLGGERLGSGKKMQVEMKEYQRSTHDLGRIVKTTMAAGPLIPLVTEVMLPGDTFDVDIRTLVRTVPTTGPVYGSFKMQIDVFKVPVRLYVGALHNSVVNEGVDIEDLKFPIATLSGNGLMETDYQRADPNQAQINPSSLLAYTGVRGLGGGASSVIRDAKYITNAIPQIAILDIYKNFYSIKSELTGRILHNTVTTVSPGTDGIVEAWGQAGVRRLGGPNYPWEAGPYKLYDGEQIQINVNNISKYEDILMAVTDPSMSLKAANEITWAKDLRMNVDSSGNGKIIFNVLTGGTSSEGTAVEISSIEAVLENSTYTREDLKIVPFALEEVDALRAALLATPAGATPDVTAPAMSVLPTALMFGKVSAATGAPLHAKFPQQGLLLKGYQSDRFSNYLNAEWIEKVNAKSSIPVTGSSINPNTLNLAQKVYNQLNRVAAAGNTYNDWMLATYGIEGRFASEIPEYCGGMSAEIVFNEVVSTAATESEPLGSLAGRGREAGEKGGTIRVSTNEAAYMIILASITPRVDYYQGNKWFNKLRTLDDLHKPELDEIGFQSLLSEEANAAATTTTGNGSLISEEIGKQPAYIEYMTSQNEIYGEFAEENKLKFMTLAREIPALSSGELDQFTSYIDPRTSNRAFADTTLDAQNFWVQVAFDIIARREMSAKIMPNL